MSDLLKKYNRPGPRYTSYPPVPFWKGAPSESEWISHLKTSYDKKTGMDLYVHVPFCERLCYYCGCNRQITRNHKVEDPYVELLLKEWQLYKDRLGFTPKINSLHFGGGTPTFLSAENLQKIIHQLTLIRSDSFQGSIEVDPRTVNTEQLDVLVNSGFRRFSLGIQDFDPAVQKSINRFQSFELVENVVKELRARNIESLNFDVIYGLPNQSVESIEKTFELVEKLSPDQIAFYSYAHLPDKLMNQRLIKSDELPGPELKQKLYETGKMLLLKAGYFDIGMDHFARPENFLYHAKVQNQLHRNFMGYVNKKSGVLLGLGPSSISDSSISFAQNAKAYTDYENAINESRLPIVSGHTHNSEELIAQKMIIELMCTDQTIIFESMPHYEEIVIELREFEKDQIIRLEGERVIVLPEGKKFIRNVVMTFDFHFREKNPINKFSQTI